MIFFIFICSSQIPRVTTLLRDQRSADDYIVALQAVLHTMCVCILSWLSSLLVQSLHSLWRFASSSWNHWLWTWFYFWNPEYAYACYVTCRWYMVAWTFMNKVSFSKELIACSNNDPQNGKEMVKQKGLQRPK